MMHMVFHTSSVDLSLAVHHSFWAAPDLILLTWLGNSVLKLKELDDYHIQST